MRTDTKIGIVLSVLVVAVAAYYFSRPGEEDVRVAGGQQLTDDGSASKKQADPPTGTVKTPKITKSDTPTPVKPDTAKERIVKVERTPPADNDKPAADVDALIDRAMSLLESDQSADAKPDASKTANAPGPQSITMPKVAAGNSATPGQPNQMPQRTDGPPAPAETPKIEIAAAPAPQAPVKPTKIHVVAEGESFASIAETHYGSQRHANFLLKSNPAVKDPRRLFVGTKLNIMPLPAGTQTASTAGSNATEKISGAGQYRVQKDDTFYGIAARKLGSGERWPELFELNRDIVGGRPETLREGQILQIPLASSGITPE
jgi:nucleoid-associated protein YgaU